MPVSSAGARPVRPALRALTAAVLLLPMAACRPSNAPESADLTDPREIGLAERRRAAFMSERPSAFRAIAASRAILDEGGRHPRTVEAAEFLVREAHGAPRSRDRIATAGVRALAEHAPGYERWPETLGWLDNSRSFRRPGAASESAIDAFLEETAAGAGDPE